VLTIWGRGGSGSGEVLWLWTDGLFIRCQIRPSHAGSKFVKLASFTYKDKRRWAAGFGTKGMVLAPILEGKFFLGSFYRAVDLEFWWCDRLSRRRASLSILLQVCRGGFVLANVT
jgi:hypothetical protein